MPRTHRPIRTVMLYNYKVLRHFLNFCCPLPYYRHGADDPERQSQVQSRDLKTRSVQSGFRVAIGLRLQRAGALNNSRDSLNRFSKTDDL